jgi:cytochrome c-type biogenesis protein CcmH
MAIWVIISALAFAVAALLALAILRGRIGDEPPAAYDLRVYRDQLKEVERDLARGVIGPDDAERIRAEVSRRILAADAQLQKGGDATAQPRALALTGAAVSLALLVGGSVWVYSRIGAPGYPDMGLASRIEAAQDARLNRISQAEAEARVPASATVQAPSPDFIRLMDQLRTAVAERPGDLQGALLLARNEAVLGNFVAAYKAQAQVLSIKGDQATAADYVDYADMMVLAAGGYVSPEAEAALRAALTRDPQNGPARYYVGLLQAQTGRPDNAFRTWEALLRDGPEGAPHILAVRAQIEDMAFRAGERNFTLPPAGDAPAAPPLAGPSADDIAAAQNMSGEDRMQMIRTMVQNLSDRLALQGGNSAEWARLIGALGVLGDERQARVIWEEAQSVFWDSPEGLAEVNDAARRAGLTE